jgi:hypothetical protein
MAPVLNCIILKCIKLVLNCLIPTPGRSCIKLKPPAVKNRLLNSRFLSVIACLCALFGLSFVIHPSLHASFVLWVACGQSFVHCRLVLCHWRLGFSAPARKKDEKNESTDLLEVFDVLDGYVSS